MAAQEAYHQLPPDRISPEEEFRVRRNLTAAGATFGLAGALAGGTLAADQEIERRNTAMRQARDEAAQRALTRLSAEMEYAAERLPSEFDAHGRDPWTEPFDDQGLHRESTGTST
ncbi:hypothetical protein, partial [Cellulomonas bogoriensis]|uniref:hypothetical protein n=1 Tax=Cellulomonas bogoriensis TaxID=301388 RepID=UPI001E46FBB3